MHDLRAGRVEHDMRVPQRPDDVLRSMRRCDSRQHALRGVCKRLRRRNHLCEWGLHGHVPARHACVRKHLRRRHQPQPSLRKLQHTMSTWRHLRRRRMRGQLPERLDAVFRHLRPDRQ